jgi:ribonuclease MRP protein subunit RMP1
MLIGILAKTKEVVEPLRHQSSEHEGLEDKLHKNRDPIAAQDFGELLERSVTESNQQRDSGGRQSDILTEAINSGTEEAATILEESNASIQSKLTPVKRPRKKRKKGDVFDDLFDKLI